MKALPIVYLHMVVHQCERCNVKDCSLERVKAIPTWLTLIGFLSSFMFIYTMSSFRRLQVTRSNGGFHIACINLVSVLCEFFDEYEGYWIE
jgi:phosphatidylglycerophosphate synthase